MLSDETRELLAFADALDVLDLDCDSSAAIYRLAHGIDGDPHLMAAAWLESSRIEVEPGTDLFTLVHSAHTRLALREIPAPEQIRTALAMHARELIAKRT